MLNRNNIVASRLEQLASGFERYLEVFEDDAHLTKSLQFDYHLMATQNRRCVGSIAAAINSDDFMNLLRETLLTWGIGVQGPNRLVSDSEFRETFSAMRQEMSLLEEARIGDTSLDLDKVEAGIWRLVSRIDIVENSPRLVPSTRALHYLLPDLVVPIDKLYTRSFFDCRRRHFDAHQQRFFGLAFRSFAQLAREVHPNQYVGDGWRSSCAKVLDNALIGYCKVHQLWLD